MLRSGRKRFETLHPTLHSNGWTVTLYPALHSNGGTVTLRLRSGRKRLVTQKLSNYETLRLRMHDACLSV